MKLRNHIAIALFRRGGSTRRHKDALNNRQMHKQMVKKK